ncbi:MAG: hypothetical protein IIU86_05195 [Oscillospiraceae bacterium]|nr:hypothetical protein [Oscillospiraceae bacterium]
MSIATDLQNTYTNLQGVLTDCNAALVNKGGKSVATLKAIARAITALPSGESNDNGSSGGNSETTTLPSWIKEMQVQTFTPEADTNAAQTFALSMSAAPNIIIIKADYDTPEALRDFMGYVGSDLLGAKGIYMQGYESYAAAGLVAAQEATSPTAATANGVIEYSATGFTYQTRLYGSENTYWRAAHTYTIITFRV